MDNYQKCITRHQSIIALIVDKTPLCVQNMINTLQSYTTKSFQDILDHNKQYVKELDDKMFIYYNVYLEYHCSKSSLQICDDVYDKIMNKEYCFQGGFGHHIYSGWRLPCHWCVKPEFYEVVKLNVYEKIALRVHGINVEIYEIPRNEIWGN